MRLSNSGVRAQTKRALSAAAVAGVAGLALAPTAAQADDDAALATAPTEVIGVDVTGSKTTEASSPKYTAPVLDTPQTITIVPDAVIRGQNLLSLRDILSTVPGITFGAGEGGGGYGDSINLRGYSANTDITVDGVRDSAQYTRSDTFNLEQLEVINGANSVFSGSGSVGGTINLVTKSPRGIDQTVLTGGVGTDDYWRGAVDADYLVSDNVAVRLNAMVHRNDVPGRDVDRNERWGVAPSVTVGYGGPTQLTAWYVHQEDENTPQYGVPYAANALIDGPLPGVDPSDYFGYRNVDKQDQVIDSLTMRIVHEFSDSLSIRNMTRWQQVTQDIIVDPPQGTYCLASGINPQHGDACSAPNTYQPSGPRGNRRDTKNTLLINQTDLTWRVATGPVNHTIVAGLAFTSEDYNLDTGNVLRNPGGATPNPVLPLMQLDNPDSLYTGPINFVRTGVSDGELRNRAVYIFDTIELTPQWELSGGLRYERNEGEFTSATIAVPGGEVTQNPVARNKDALVSYRVGVVYKPVPNASIYASLANSRTPSQGTVNGGCSNTGAAQNCNLDPEKAKIIEVGAKWDAMGGRLSLTGSVFRNERENYRVSTGDPAQPTQVLDGASRVNGVTLGASGLVRNNWSVFANYTYLDSKIIQNVPNGVVDPVAGDPIPLTPKHAFSAWTTYDLPVGVQLGYGVTYQGEVPFSRLTTAPGAPGRFVSDSYWVHSLAATWRATRAVEVQLNVKNVFDKEYYTRIRANNGFGWATPGEARSATLTVNYRF
ncbi:MAG TPA: TonB-dependent siderophore receptor [Phenylobacterium sp.]|nr:TonB-dependent siderophore receptor [Phenylobacterium sp.]